MEQSNPKASLVRIVQSDYLATLAVLFPIVMFGFYIVTSDPLFLNLTLIALAVGIAVLIWRIRLVQVVFVNGTEVAGQVKKVFFYRGRGRVEYTYTYQGQNYSGANAIMKSRRTEALAPGANITVVVHKSSPKRAFIRDLYT